MKDPERPQMTDPCDDWHIALMRHGVREQVRAHHPDWTEEKRAAMREQLFRINPSLRHMKRTDSGDPCDDWLGRIVAQNRRAAA